MKKVSIKGVIEFIEYFLENPDDTVSIMGRKTNKGFVHFANISYILEKDGFIKKSKQGRFNKIYITKKGEQVYILLKEVSSLSNNIL